MSFTHKSRIRMQHSIHDMVLCELWLANEPEIATEEVEEAFSRIQARMLVLQAILWPSDDDLPPENDSQGA